MKKKFIVLCLVVVSLFSFLGCNTTSEDEMVTVVDMVGDTVEVPKNPTNVAVIARAAADMMIGFGLGNSVDGIYYSVLENPWVSLIYPAASNFYSYDYNESAELFL